MKVKDCYNISQDELVEMAEEKKTDYWDRSLMFYLQYQHTQEDTLSTKQKSWLMQIESELNGY